MTDLAFMHEALTEALTAFRNGEYPVGAVVVRGGRILSRAGNTANAENDPTAHAEIGAIRQACKALASLQLRDCTLYTTLQPCPMCESVIVESGIKKVVYGGRTFAWIKEVKYGTAETELVGPVLDDECRGVFEKRLRERGRRDILDYEDR